MQASEHRWPYWIHATPGETCPGPACEICGKETEYKRLTREWTARRRKGIALALGWIVWGIGCLLLGYTLAGGWL